MKDPGEIYGQEWSPFEGMERMHVRRYSGGEVECSWNLHRSTRRTPPGAARGESEDVEGNRIRSVSRARKMITRKVVHGGLTYLLTLTYRENVTDLDRMRKDRERFCDVVQARLPGWAYLGTYERQQRGAWHAHLAVRGWQDVDMLRRIWWGVVGAGQGNVDVRSPRQRKDGNARAAMGLYMGKYVGKDLGEWELNRKNYYHSRGVEEPPVSVVQFRIEGNFGCEECAALLLRLSGQPVARRWVSSDGWMGVVSSY